MNSQLETALDTIYGSTNGVQGRRYLAAINVFRALYGAQGAISILRAPGRVNLIGEHTDYNHGFVLPAALDKDMLLLARPRRDNQIYLTNVEAKFPSTNFAIQPPVTLAAKGHWSNYVRGAAQVLAEQVGRPITGFDAVLAGAAPYGVPRGAGLSSSSSLTVVAMLTLAHFAQVQLSEGQLVQLCSDAEWYVGTRGGIMDQFTELFAQRNHALFLDCRPEASGNYQVDHIPLPSDYRIMVVDSGVHHENTRNEFNQRVAACRTGVALLRQHYPAITHLRDVQQIDWATLAPHLPENMTVAEVQAQQLQIGEIPGLQNEMKLRVRACSRHVWTENQRVLDALTAMRKNEIATLGNLLNEAHQSARDDYTISCPEVEVLVDAAREVEGVAGARLTGAGWGGCIVALVHESAVAAFERHVKTRYEQAVGRIPDVFQCAAGPGARLVAEVL